MGGKEPWSTLLGNGPVFDTFMPLFRAPTYLVWVKYSSFALPLALETRMSRC